MAEITISIHIDPESRLYHLAEIFARQNKISLDTALHFPFVVGAIPRAEEFLEQLINKEDL